MSYERIITHLSCEDEYLTFVIMLLCFKQTKKRSIKRINQYNINRMLTFGFPTWINTLLSIFTLSFLTRYDEILFVKRIINFPFNWLIPEFNIYHITVTGFLNKKKKKKTIRFISYLLNWKSTFESFIFLVNDPSICYSKLESRVNLDHPPSSRRIFRNNKYSCSRHCQSRSLSTAVVRWKCWREGTDF